MIDLINKSWNWVGAIAHKVVLTNDFGNVIFISESEEYWRICPEELSCKRIAGNIAQFDDLIQDSDFKLDWEMANIINTADDALGPLKDGEVYYLVKPAILGGEYDISNIQKIPIEELIVLSGDLGRQVSDLEDGQKIDFKIE